MTVECPRCKHVFLLRPKRSGNQSRLFHKLNGAYARAVGEDPEETKVQLKYWHGTWEAFPFPDGEVPEWPGRFVELWEGTADWCIVYMKSESAYDKAEETRIIEGATIKCMDVGADLSWMGEM